MRARLDKIATRHPSVIEEVRGKGFLLGLKCVVPNTDFVARLRDAGLLTVPAAENVVRMVPPLVIGEAQIDEAAAMIEQTCARWAQAA